MDIKNYKINLCTFIGLKSLSKFTVNENVMSNHYIFVNIHCFMCEEIFSDTTNQ